MDGLGLDSSDDKGAPRPGVKDFLKWKARRPPDGCVQVVDRYRVVGVSTFLVTRTIHEATLDPTSGEHRTKAYWIMASTISVELRLATELRSQNNESAVQHTPLIQVSDQSRIGLVEGWTQVLHLTLQVVVHVPAICRLFDVTYAGLDQAASKEASLSEFTQAVFFARRIRFFSQVKGIQILAFEKAKSVVIKLAVGLDVLIRITVGKERTELLRQGQPLPKCFTASSGPYVFEALVRVKDGYGTVSRREKTVSMLRGRVDASRRRKSPMALSEVVLSPCSEVGVLDGIALGKSRSHEVLSRAMNPYLCGHTSDHRDSIGNFRSLRQILGNLKISFRSDRIPRAFRRAAFGVKSIDMAHTSFDLEENDSLGLAESICALCRLIAF